MVDDNTGINNTVANWVPENIATTFLPLAKENIHLLLSERQSYILGLLLEYLTTQPSFENAAGHSNSCQYRGHTLFDSF